MATSRWERFLPFTCPVHHVSPAGGELSQVSPLLESTALIHSRRESPGVLQSVHQDALGPLNTLWDGLPRAGIVAAMPGYKMPPTQTCDSSSVTQSVPRMRSAAEARKRKSGRTPETAPEPSLQAVRTGSVAPSHFTYKMKTQR